MPLERAGVTLMCALEDVFLCATQKVCSFRLVGFSFGLVGHAVDVTALQK